MTAGELTVPVVREDEEVDADAPRGEHISLRTHLLALLGYVVLTVVLTWPVAANLFTQIPGGGDAWHNVWNLWWVKQAVVSGQWNVYHTDLLYFPEGVNLYFHTLALTAGIMSLPLQLVGFNLLASYNLVMLSSFVLAGYGTFLLCHYLLGILNFEFSILNSKAGGNNSELRIQNSKFAVGAAFVGGLVFAFAPYHLAHMFGHLNLTMVQWIPFYVLLLLKAVNAPSPKSKVQSPKTGVTDKETTSAVPGVRRSKLWTLDFGLRYAVGAGVLLAVNTYTDLLYGIFLALLTGMLLVWRVALPSERRAFREAGVGWREGLVRLAVGLAAFFVLTAPMLIPALIEAEKGYAQQSVDEAIVYSSDAILAFTPSELHPIWGKAVAGRVSQMGEYLPFKNSSERTVFLGYTVLALSGFACWRLRKNRSVRFWAFAAVATWVLSLGPVLQVFGRTRVPFFGGTFPMPYAILQHLPLLNIMRTPGRLTVLTMLALAVLTAFGIAMFKVQSPKFKVNEGNSKFRIQNSKFAIGAAALILFEFLAVPFPTVPPGWGLPFYDKVAAEPGRFALLNLPERNIGDYMAFQTRHGKPIIGGFLARQPPYATLENTPALRYLLDDTKADSALRQQVAGGKGVQALRDIGVKYIVMNWWLMSKDQIPSMEEKLTALLDTGDGRARDPDFVYPEYQVGVWQLGP